MKIESLIEHLGDPNIFLYLERYVDEGSRTYSPFSHQSEVELQYQPINKIKSFEVPCLLIPKESVTIYLDNPDVKLLNHYIQKDTVLFPIHPEIFEDTRIIFMEELRKFLASSICVSPTASTRTVMTMETKADTIPIHFIKLHYPRQISRFIRRLRENTIQNCLETSKDLKNLSIENFAYLPETIGMTYGSGPDSWGFIIRETDPRPKLDNKRYLLPLFSLYSQDLNYPNDFPLLIQLIKFLNEDPKTFTLNHIMKPIIQIWCTALKERGLVFEMHGQNTLLELDSRLSPTRIIYRDLDVYIDPEIREKHQLSLKFPKSHLIKDENRESVYSLKYDAFIGHHLFDYLSSILETFYGIDPNEIQKGCKEAFHHFFPDADLYFKDRTFYYSNEINKHKIIETTDRPKWR